MTARAVKNANPGNLESGPDWFGLVPPGSMTPEQKAEPRFAVFQEPKYGFRALAITLLNYKKKHGLDTVKGIIGRFAPSVENDTKAYIKSVCDSIGADPDAKLDLSNPMTMRALCRAIAVHESGGWFFQIEDLITGVSLALRT